MSNEEYYKDNDDNDVDEFSGFSIVDEQGVEIERLKKLLHEAIKNDDEPTIASAIPENELTVILDNAAVLLPELGQELDFKFFDENGTKKGSVFYKDNKVGDFKSAFVSRLFEQRVGQFCLCLMHSETPVMVKLLFKTKSAKNYKQIR